LEEIRIDKRLAPRKSSLCMSYLLYIIIFCLKWFTSNMFSPYSVFQLWFFFHSHHALLKIHCPKLSNMYILHLKLGDVKVAFEFYLIVLCPGGLGLWCVQLFRLATLSSFMLSILWRISHLKLLFPHKSLIVDNEIKQPIEHCPTQERTKHV